MGERMAVRMGWLSASTSTRREAQTLGRRIGRKATLLLVGAVYLLSVGSYWVAVTVAWYRSFSGLARYAGVFFLPGLALPIVGRGAIAGIAVHSFVWWGWFAFHMLVAGIMVALYPRSGERGQEEPLDAGGGPG